ncbi:hypothetical protein ABZ958_27395 [Streptomyces sp. NPDC046237]|uniref:hypothetical protein n=1 Tax=Streptomyces sp. NPDC046237 TaxID=3154914 RepID=UPI0033FFF702
MDRNRRPDAQVLRGRPTTISHRPDGALVVRGDLAVGTAEGVRLEPRATRTAPIRDPNGPCRPTQSSPADNRS